MSVSSAETFEFQTETRDLLNLMVHALYTQKDIFLRELISNASDAIDRLRFEALTTPGLLEGAETPEIRITVDGRARTLTVSDNGIGMTRDEVKANIGTIARSGTRELRKRLVEAGNGELPGSLIGQFGVGFYAVFMVADRVRLVTRRAGESVATEWESIGDGTYGLADADRAGCGTTVTLHLKPVDPDSGIDDYTDVWQLTSIIKRHSDFIAYPILIPDVTRVDDGAAAAATTTRVVNTMKPIWKRSAQDVTREQHAELYRSLAHDWTEPLKAIHLKAEGTFEYDALLYVPGKAAYDLYYVAPDTGLRLFAKQVVIMEKCEELLPRYLRFIRGVVDAADLPLNISRQRLQHDRHLTLIRKRLTKKVLDALQDLQQEEPETYRTVWREFGRALKEGVAFDHDHRERLVGLLLCQSSHDRERETTLAEYVSRMKEGQERIFYLTGESREVAECSPHLEALRAQGYEVLYFVDPVDELMLQHLTEFSGRKMKSAAKGLLDLAPSSADDNAATAPAPPAEFQPLLDALQRTLDAHVRQVRLSSRLTSSAACLVVEDHDYSPQLERALQKNKPGSAKRRVLELNAGHPMIERLRVRQARDESDPHIARAAQLLLGLSLLAEGSPLIEPVAFQSATAEMLQESL